MHCSQVPELLDRRVLGVLLGGILGVVGVFSSAQAQAVKLLYDEGGVFSDAKYVTIAHADAKGNVRPDTSTVRAADQLYFAYRPTGDWTFETEDKQILRQITLAQDTSILTPQTVMLVGQADEARAAVVGVPKSRIDWLTPVSFQHRADTSKGLPIKEYYAPGYPPLRRAYEEGRRLLNESKPLEAVKRLRPFFGKQKPAFTLASNAWAVLDTAASEVLDRTRSDFRRLRERLVSSPDAEGLARLDSFRVRLDSVRAILHPYVKARPEARADVQTRLENLTNSSDQLYANARSTYRRETLWVFLRGKYAENPRLSLYLDVLTQMLMDVESAFNVAELRVDSLRPSLLETPGFAEARRKLRANGWEGEFREIVELVNENIREQNEVFGKEIMRSLRLRRPPAPQPYYEIAAAMNAILDGNRARFSEAWGRALEKVESLALLDDLQRWRLVSRMSPDAVPNRARKLTREAQSFRKRGDLEAAEASFQLAASLSRGNAPAYYELGRVQQVQGDTSAARESFQRARILAPSYAPPVVSDLRLLLNQEKYTRALARSDSLLREQAYWLLYTPKARALLGLGRYNEARQVLRNRCEPLNDKSYALYTLLAEAYAGMGMWKSVAWALQRADALSPRRPVFAQRMSEVRKAAKEEGVSLTKAEGDSVRTKEPRENPDVGAEGGS